MNSDYKIVFIDIDGTLVDDDKKISSETKRYLKELDSCEIPVVLTSGRMPAGVKPYLEALELKRPIITFGGGLVLDEKGETLLSNGLSFKEAERIAKFVDEKQIKPAFNFYVGSNWYTNNLEHPMEQYEARMIGFPPETADFKNVVKSNDTVAKCLFAGFEEEIDELRPLAEEFFPNLTVLKSQSFLLEIYNRNVSKAAGIQRILDYYQVDVRQAIGIGDSYNDLEMLDFVGLPVIMVNAPEDLRSNPKYVKTKFNNNQNGAVEFLKQIFG